MKLSREEVRHVAELAKLALTDEEIDQFAEQLSDILDYAEQIQQVDTSGVEGTPYILPLANVMQDDEVKPSLRNEAALKNAPDTKGDYFRVRAIFDD